MRVVLVVLVLAFLPGVASCLELQDVPLDHWAYEMLERFEARASLGRSGLDTRPLRREQMARLVRRLGESAARGEWTPTRIEEAQLDMLRSEFSDELIAQGDTLLPLYCRAWHRWDGKHVRFQLFLVGRQSATRTTPGFDADQSQVDARFLFEPAGAVAIGKSVLAFEQLSLRVRTSNGVLQQGTDVRGGEATFVYAPGDRFSVTRTAEPYVRFGRGPFLADLGRERLRWGPGRHNSLLIQDGTPPLDMLRLELDLGWLRFTNITAQMRPAELVPTDPDFTEKYLAAHRLVLVPHRRLTLAVSDAVVWGDRGIDLAYANPLAIFYVTQANIGDTDNALASVDAKLLLPGIELYGEVLVDDLNLRRGLDDFGNKVGLLGGLFWPQPFGADDWEAEFEWSWASEFTYTHEFPINRYEHYGTVLGSRAGTDADLWFAGLGRRLSRGWTARAVYELERHGEGNVATAAEPQNIQTQEFLSGVVESRHRPGIDLVYRGLRSLEVTASWRYLHVTQPGHDAAAGDVDSQEALAAIRVEF